MRPAVPVLLLLAAFMPSCRGCSKTSVSPAAMLAFADAGAKAALWTDDFGATLQEHATFVAALAGPGSAAALQRGREVIQQRLGFDPLSDDGFKTAGIDVHKGWLVFTPETSRLPLMVMATRDGKIFDAYMQGLMARTDGADSHQQRTVAGHLIHTVGRPFGDSIVPALHWAHVGEHVVVATAEAQQDLQQLLSRQSTTVPQEPAASSSCLQARKALVNHGPAGTLFAFARLSGSAADPNAQCLAAQWRVSKTGMRMDSFVNLPMPQVRSALLARGADANHYLALSSEVDEDAVALALSRAPVAEVWQVLQQHPAMGPWLHAMAAKLSRLSGVAVEQDLVPLLDGNLTAWCEVANLQTLMAARSGRASSAALARAVGLQLLTDVREPEKVLEVLRQAQHKRQENGNLVVERVAALGASQAHIFEPAGPHPELGWALFERRYLYSGGAGRLDQTLQDLAAKKRSTLPDSLQQSVVGRALVAADEPLLAVGILRFGKLADALFAQGGQQAPALRGVAEVGMHMLRRLGDAVSTLRVSADGVRLGVHEDLT